MGTALPRRAERSGSAARPFLASGVAVGLVVLAVVLLANPLLSSAGAGPAPRASPTPFTTSPTVKIYPSHVTGVVPSSFWGVDQQTDLRLGSLQSSVLLRTPARYVLWPAGQQGDGYDAKANLLHLGGGTAIRPNESLGEFVGWCRSVGCHAILTVPGEIDNASYAAWEVGFVEHTLGFRPAFWEIGNEPAHWRHFKIPWSRWSWSQNVNATPVPYADVVASYITAMKRVDPAAPILGLPGTGHGASGETTWIKATVRVNGPRLAGVGIHVYPAGHPNNGQESLAQFFGSLSATSNGSLARRVPLDRAAIAAACSTCHIALLVTEWGSATVGSLSPSTSEWKFVNGFPEVPFVTAMLVQGMQDHVLNMDLFALQEPYIGSLINFDSGTLRYLGRLYTTVLPHLDTETLALTNYAASRGLLALAARTSTSSSMSLLLVNTNVFSSITVNLAGSGFFTAGAGYAYTWSSSTYSPVRHSWTANAPTSWTLPAMSVALIVGTP